MRWLAMVMVVGCAQVEPQAAAPAQPVELAPTAPSLCGPAELDRNLSVQHHNGSYLVMDPAVAMRTTRARAKELGFDVQYASANATNASVTVRMPAGSDPGPLLDTLDGRIQSESTSTSDYRPQVQQMCERLRTADAAMQRTAQLPPSEDVLLMRELLQRERTNLETQFRSYVQQSTWSQVSLNFQPIPG